MKKMIILGLLLFGIVQIQADQYVLIMSKDDKVCQHMNHLYNHDLLSKHEKVILENHPEYNWITWKEEVTFKKDRDVYAAAPLSYHKELFDINNDGYTTPNSQDNSL